MNNQGIQYARSHGNLVHVVVAAILTVVGNSSIESQEFRSAEVVRSIDFATEIIPVLTKAGCNSGACHGAAAGRGGFHLSLLGSDPIADHDSIVHALEGRRVNLARPELSLLLTKPTGVLDHGGEQVLEEDGEGAKRIADWIASGAELGGNQKPIDFQVVPRVAVIDKVGQMVPLRTMAKFLDRSPVDVSKWTVFTANDPSAIEIDTTHSVAKVLRPGQHVIVARFMDRVVPIQLLVPIGTAPVDLSSEIRKNFVDDEVIQSLTLLRLPVSPQVDDGGFLRRVTLDLTGRIPTRQQVEAFQVDQDRFKREKAVDQLLKGEPFVDYWTYRFAKLFRIRPLPNDKLGATIFQAWVREQVKQATPLSQVAYAMITGEGDTHVDGPANFARVATDARGHAEMVSQVWMGVRLQCANCHNHPLDRWTQDDYHGLASIFARLDRGRIVKQGSRGSVTNLRTGEPANPRIPGQRNLDGLLDGRHELGLWFIEKNNPYFAKAIVNRLWKAMFGRGLVEPTDDLRETNPSTHPELLQKLTDDFVNHGYDLRHTLRLLATSSTYSRSWGTNSVNNQDDRFYSHAFRRSLEAEVLADAIAEVTGVFDQYGEEALGTRAIDLIDPRTPSNSLDVLGRCNRQTSCETVEIAPSLPTKLHLLNGDLINRKITSPDGHLHKMLNESLEMEMILKELYYRAFSRPPTDVERQHWMSQLSQSESTEPASRLEDLFWSLLNCSEFLTNH